MPRASTCNVAAVFTLAALAWPTTAMTQWTAEVVPNPATPWQLVGLLASVNGNSCSDDIEVRNVTKAGSEVLVEYAIVPATGRGCFLPIPLTLRAPLGTFAPGVYRVRTIGVAAGVVA